LLHKGCNQPTLLVAEPGGHEPEDRVEGCVEKITNVHQVLGHRTLPCEKSQRVPAVARVNSKPPKDGYKKQRETRESEKPVAKDKWNWERTLLHMEANEDRCSTAGREHEDAERDLS
jgi:hypothetical protein